MSTNLSKIEIFGYNVPEWVKEWLNANSGVTVINKTFEDFKSKPPLVFLTFEKELWKKTDKIFEVMNQAKIKNLVVVSNHLYLFEDNLLKKINELSKDKNVTFLTMGSILTGYENIKCYSFDVIEHSISNDFNFLLSNELKQHRNPTKDFAFFIHMQDTFRKQIYDGLAKSNVLNNSVLLKNSKENILQIVKAQNVLYDSLKEIGANDNILQALKGWGFTPNFEVYEKVFCEIVIESSNEHTLSDLSEKTYRPIALNIPFVFLGQKLMYDKLHKDGYKLIDNDNFYRHWHGNESLEKKLPYLIDFLETIKQDKNLRKKLEQMAEHNYANFWTKRKLNYISNNYKIIKKVLGENLVQKIYSKLNF